MAIIAASVRTYSGFKGDERPISFAIGDKELGVEEIEDTWYGPDHAYFKIKAEDGNLYVLRHDLEKDIWEVVLMEAGGVIRGW